MRRFFHPLEPRRLLAATYYVSALGNDSLDGRSTKTAWRTIAKVNAHNFDPGDKVLFEGGKTFTIAGSSSSEAIVNGGFESGLTNWSDTMGTDAARASATTTSRHSGSRSIKISGDGDGARAQNVTAKLKKSQAYRLSAWTRTVNLGGGERRIGITFYQSGKPVATFYRGYHADYWANTTFEFVSPRSFDKALLWVSRKGDGSTFYADDISIKSIPNGLVFDDTDSGSSSASVVVGSYGDGKATINARDGIGLWGANVSNFSVQNLIFTGSWSSTTGSGNNAGDGIAIVNTRFDNSKLDHVSIEKCEAKGFRWSGVVVGGWAAKSGFQNLFITDTLAHHNGDIGILVRGEFARASTAYANQNVHIARCSAWENSGIPNKGANSGNGILISDTLIGTIERCVAHDNGRFNNEPREGPVGIWAFDASKITIQFNESHHNYTASTKDGGGFDLDGGVTNSIIQNNYSHDNDGPGFLLCQFSGARPFGKNILRYNLSQNDARKNSYGAITLTGGLGPANAVVEHNTVYLNRASSGTSSGINVRYAQSGVLLRNNIISTSGAAAVKVDSAGKSAVFTHNNYWTGGSSSYDVAAGGTSVDPMLAAPGTAPTLNDPFKLNTLSQYRLKSGSPMTDTAGALTSPFTGYTAAVYDFFGNALPGTKRDLGASES